MRITALMFVTMVLAALVDRPAVRRARPDPASAPEHRRRVRDDRARLQGRPERDRAGDFTVLFELRARAVPRAHRTLSAAIHPRAASSCVDDAARFAPSTIPTTRRPLNAPAADHLAPDVFTVIPIAIVLGSITGFQGSYEAGAESGDLGGRRHRRLLFLPPLLMLLFREKYPRWWFDWNLELQRFVNRVASTSRCSTTATRRPTSTRRCGWTSPYPDAQQDLNRWLPLVKWLLAIPHYIVLFVLYIGAFFVVIAAWFAILFTGRYPRGLFDYLVGVGRWHNRVVAYAFTLVTDRYRRSDGALATRPDGLEVRARAPRSRPGSCPPPRAARAPSGGTPGAVITTTLSGLVATTVALRRVSPTSRHLAEEVTRAELGQQLVAAPHLARCPPRSRRTRRATRPRGRSPALLQLDLVRARRQGAALLAVEPWNSGIALSRASSIALPPSPGSARRP